MSAALAAGVLLGLSNSPAAAAEPGVPQVQTVQYYYGGPPPYAYRRPYYAPPYYRPYPRQYAHRYYAPPPPYYRPHGRPHFYRRPYY